MDIKSFKDALNKLENGHFFELVVFTNDTMIAFYERLEVLDFALSIERNSKVALITPAMRPGATLFWQVLEHNYFTPLTERNQEFHFMYALFCDIPFALCVIPAKDADTLTLVAQQTGMAITQNPTVLGIGGQIHKFPVSGSNVFWMNHAEEGDRLHYQASEHALTKLARGEYTPDQASKEVKDAQRVLYKQETEKLRAFWREKGIKET